MVVVVLALVIMVIVIMIVIVLDCAAELLAFDFDDQLHFDALGVQVLGQILVG